jgi:hypothetical protein
LPFDYYRVESDWCDEARQHLTTSLNCHSIPVPKHPPGFNRNLLLEKLYNSDADWLVCLDDDRQLYPMYGGDNFFKDLGSPAVIKLAEAGHLITCTPPNFEPFKKDVCSWPYKETHWYMFRETPYGFLQVCFIPNLAKYGYEPIYFDEVSMAQENEIPEDAEFQVDWLVSRHPVYICTTLYNKALDNYVQSSIYKSGRFRYMTNKGRIDTLNRYIKQEMKYHPEVTDLISLSKRRNTALDQRLLAFADPNLSIGGTTE